MLGGSAAALTLTAGCSIPFFGPEPDSFDATYDYSFGFDAYGTLTDVTIRAPLPVGPDGTPITAELLVPDGVVRDYEDEAVFDARIVDTEHGPMLELTTPEFTVVTRYYAFVEEDGTGRRVEISEEEYDPENRNHQVIDFHSAGVGVTLDAEYPLETRVPVGAEPVFPAMDERTATACDTPTSPEATCFVYDGPFYLSYEAAEDTRLQTFVRFEGYNEWFAGGWTGNRYHDHLAVDATGPQDGWLEADGELLTGDGRYRD